MNDTTKSRGPIVTPKRCFHTASWLGIATAAYTNFEAAPNAHLQVAYLSVPVLAACLSEGLIRGWSKIDSPVRLFVGTILAALLATSYEHFSNLIESSGGSWFSSHVGAGVVDAAILACVIATCTMPEDEETLFEQILPEPVFVAPIPEIVPVVEEKLPEIETAINEVRKIAESGISKPTTPTPVGGKRAENERKDIEAMTALWPDISFFLLEESERHSAVMNGMKCGGSRATRLVGLYSEHVAKTMKEGAAS